MNSESTTCENKSILKIRSGNKNGFASLAQTCVAFANTKGGTINIGIEDGKDLPPENQQINIEEINDTLKIVRDKCVSVAITASEILIALNGGQYFSLYILPSVKTIASTSDGKYFIRIGEQTKPCYAEDLIHLVAEKDNFQWELQPRKTIAINQLLSEKIAQFSEEIRASDRVSKYVKNFTDLEIAEYYMLIQDGVLTNLGVLWLGSPQQRARLSYPLTIQYIVYNDLDEKVNKLEWRDNRLNPKELLLDIEKKAIELTYYHEFPNGLFRKKIRHYDQRVIRELLINAIAHRSYTISQDIFIEVYPSELHISSPGGLPTGVTAHNILHKRVRRNSYMIRILHDLGLMEGEGSGYDKIYEVDSRDTKPFPQLICEFDFTKVIQSSKILNAEAIVILDYIDRNYQIKPFELIVLGIIVREEKVNAMMLKKALQLTDDQRLNEKLANLVEEKILLKRGSKKATIYLLNPILIANSHSNIKTTLKTIEPHVLVALVKQDLVRNPNSKIIDVHHRLKDVDFNDIRKCIYSLKKEGIVLSKGARKNMAYSLA
jgi:ATP-dependent DNA helicase RecG